MYSNKPTTYQPDTTSPPFSGMMAARVDVCPAPQPVHTTSTKTRALTPSSKPSAKAPLDTLAQPRKPTPDTSSDEDFDLSKNTHARDEITLQKRARAKYLTNGIVTQLANLEDSPLHKAYWNTYHCASILERTGDKVTAQYCKNRWCLVCNRIRTAQLINTYRSIAMEWDQRLFVTLTVPNCSGDLLPDTIQEMEQALRRITDVFRKRSKKGNGQSLVAIKKLEVTYNPTRKDYHPHFHLLCDSDQVATDLIQEWLKRFPAATREAQDMREGDNNALVECFKYFTKIITKVRNGDKTTTSVNVEALDTIFQAIKGKRTFQPIGFKQPAKMEEKSEEEEKADQELAHQVDQVTIFEWDKDAVDWIDKKTGEMLSGYEPTEKMQKLVENITSSERKEHQDTTYTTRKHPPFLRPIPQHANLYSNMQAKTLTSTLNPDHNARSCNLLTPLQGRARARRPGDPPEALTSGRGVDANP